MKYELLNLLICPGCLSKLHLREELIDKDEVIEGRLKCLKCNLEFFIWEKIVIFGLKEDQHTKEKLKEMEGEFNWVYNRHSQKEHLDYLRNYLPIMNKEIMNIAKKRENPLILDLGAGCGECSFLFASYGAKVVAIDIMPEFIRSAEALISEEIFFERILGDVEVLPFASNSFDIVFCKEVLHHLLNLKATLKEIARILKKEGILIAWEPVKGIISKKESLSETSLIHKEHTLFSYLNYFRKYFKLISWKSLLEEIKIKDFLKIPKILIPLYIILKGGGVSFILSKKDLKELFRERFKIKVFSKERFYKYDYLVEEEKRGKMKEELKLLKEL
jgi:ubiquinone/menaquinone biosynthesis C-methylase UbiE